MIFIKNYRTASVMMMFSIFAFLLYVWPYFFSQNTSEKLIFSSPDETATFIFSNYFLEHGSFSIVPDEPFPDFVHPRSTQRINGHLVPNGFLGQMILYGVLARVFRVSIIFFTPFLTIVAAWAVYGFFVHRHIPRIHALCVAILFLFHPAVLYYTARGLLPNMAFVNILIFSTYFFSLFLKTHRNTLAVAAAFLIGMALSVRPVEAGWVLALLLLFMALKRKYFSIKLLVGMGTYIMLALVPLGYYNIQTYGGIVQTGYADSTGRLVPEVFANSQPTSYWSYIIFFIAPFSLDMRQIANNIWEYWLYLFRPFTLLAFLGVFSWYKKRPWYVWGFIVAGVWLVILYGSWEIRDTISGQPGLGVSYVRYWLPVYIMMIPFIVQGIFHLPRKIVPVVLVGVLAYSVSAAFVGGPDALAHASQDRGLYGRIFSEIRRTVPPNAIIVSERSDKIFFPEYQVIDVTHASDARLMWPRLSEISDTSRLYYFSIYPPTSVEFINTTFLRPQGIGWRFVKNIESEYYVYELTHV